MTTLSPGRVAPGPRRLFSGPALFFTRRDPLNLFSRMAATYGDVVRIAGAGRDAYLLSHPDLIRDVLVTHNRCFMKGEGLQRARALLGNGLLTSEGDFHHRQRRLAQPAFHRQRIEAYAEVMAEYAVRRASAWRAGSTVDVAAEMNRLALAIVGRTLFGADVETEAGEIKEAVDTTISLFRTMLLPFASFFYRWPIPPRRRFDRARRRLDGIIYRMIEERRAAGVDTGDFLSMLLQAHDDEGTGGMTDEQLRDEAMTIFLAGHETTANALAWTWYLLSLNPGAREQLEAEVDRVLGDRLPGAPDLPDLPYAGRVLSESMRLYPPAWIIGRRALEDYEAGGYLIPAGSIVAMSQWVTHRDSRWYPEPGRFDPDRWTPEARASRPKFSYFPFGGGTRQCIGESFAWMEGILVLATIARRWRLELAPGQTIVPQPIITLRPRDGIRMVVRPR